MSKELEALNEIAYCYGYDKNIEIINKALEALEIIKETLSIEEEDFFYDEELDKYFFIGNVVSKDKYDLLNEVLYGTHQ